MADNALPWRRTLLTAWTWSPILTISADTRTVRGDLNVRSPCLLAILFLAIHSFLPETQLKKSQLIHKNVFSNPRLFHPPLSVSLMLMTYLMSYVLYLLHLKYLSLMLGRMMLTCDSFALAGWTSTLKGGFSFTRQCHSSISTYKTRTFIFESSRTHKLVVRYEVMYYPNELSIMQC